MAKREYLEDSRHESCEDEYRFVNPLMNELVRQAMLHSRHLMQSSADVEVLLTNTWTAKASSGQAFSGIQCEIRIDLARALPIYPSKGLNNFQVNLASIHCVFR